MLEILISADNDIDINKGKKIKNERGSKNERNNVKEMWNGY